MKCLHLNNFLYYIRVSVDRVDTAGNCRDCGAHIETEGDKKTITMPEEVEA